MIVDMKKTNNDNKEKQKEPATIIVMYSAWYNFVKKLFQIFFKSKRSQDDKK